MATKRYTAMDHNGFSIITVLADDEKAAKTRIEYELRKNRSRRAYLASWKKGGEVVKEHAD
jgi:hypothetical protein